MERLFFFNATHKKMNKITLINPKGQVKVIPEDLYKKMPAHKYGLKPHHASAPPKSVQANMPKPPKTKLASGPESGDTPENQE